MNKHAKRSRGRRIPNIEEKTSRGQKKPTGPSSRRKLSIEDVPDTLRVIECGMINELPAWLNAKIVSAIQQLKEEIHGTSHGVGNVQILLNVIEARKLQLATVAHQGEKN